MPLRKKAAPEYGGNKLSRTLEIHQGFDEEYLREILTRDIDPAEAVFDLIDNSIDAARDSIIATKTYKTDKYGLPASYSGYKISLRITESGICIFDNSRGIGKEELSNDTFKIGQPSNHKHGIGFFGVGLKRALLTLGDEYLFQTKTSNFSAKLQFSAEDMSSRDEPLIGNVLDKKGKPSTLICIKKLRPSAAHEFSTDESLKKLSGLIQRRFGLFVKKGLKLSVNGKLVPAFGPSLRPADPIPPNTFQKASARITTFIESGMHEKYRSTKEQDYDKATNDGLTAEFGWYVVCNDRLIEIASKEPRLGFSATWHAEYNGFVGWLHFVSDYPGDLPWNTKKTRIDTNLKVFQDAHPKLKKFSDDFRAVNRLIRKPKKPPSSKPVNPASIVAPTPSSKPTNPPPPRPPIPAKVHVGQWQKLLPKMVFGWKDSKLESLLSEAEELGLIHSYSSSALLRMIVERTLQMHIRKSKNLPSIKEYFVQEKAKQGETVTPDQTAKFDPTLRWMVDWLRAHQDYFPAETKKECVQSLGLFSKALSGVLNDAVHGALIIDSDRIKQVRNETYPLLSFLLENDPSKQKMF